MNTGTILLNIFVLLNLCQVFAQNYEVQTQSGLVTGKPSAYDPAVLEYLGIPYAEPPVGNLRFEKPVEKGTWNGTLRATQYGAICPQDMATLQTYATRQLTTYEDVRNIEAFAVEDEDCLFLNIFTPARNSTDLLPVIVFVHGGDFSYGSGSLFNGVVLSRLYDVVMVTINYRLGAFGFLSDGSNKLPGNYGMLDQQMALNWVKTNIKNFGGDGSQITLMGEGEGASSVHLHMAAVVSQGLFNKAIIQGASYDDQLWNTAQARDNHQNFMNITSVNSLEDLRNLSWESLNSASIQLQWSPVANDNFVSKSTRNLLSQKGSAGSKIKVLVGSNNRAGVTLAQDQVSRLESSTVGWQINSVVSLATRAFPQEYPNITNDETANLLQSYVSYYAGYGAVTGVPIWDDILNEEVYTDQLYTTWAHEISSLQSYGGGEIYSYQLWESSPVESTSAVTPVWATGATPGDDLSYVFGFLLDDALAPSATGINRDLAEIIMTYWTNFAKTGNPNNLNVQNAALVSWPQFQAENSNESLCRQIMTFDVQNNNQALRVKQNKETSRSWQFWIKYYEFIGFSCTKLVAEDIEADSTDKPPECEAGVWSDAGADMSNQLAGDLLITFICLTLFFLLLFLFCWFQNSKIKKKLKKLAGGDDHSSTYSNDANQYL